MNNKKKYLKDLKKELDDYKSQLSNIQKEFTETTGENVEKIQQSLQSILYDAVVAYGKLESASAGEWEPIKAITDEAFNNLRDSFQEKIDSSKQQIKACAGQIGENCQGHVEGAASYIRKNPFKSLFFAAGIGFIIGKILK